MLLSSAGDAVRGALEKLDADNRVGERKALRLPETCSLAFLYSIRREGGLGIHQLVRLIPKIASHRNLRLLTSEYISVKTIADDCQISRPKSAIDQYPRFTFATHRFS